MRRSICICLLLLAVPAWGNLARWLGPGTWPNQADLALPQWSARGEAIRSTDPASNVVSRIFDPAGNQITLTNRNGKRWQFQFDDDNRLATFNGTAVSNDSDGNITWGPLTNNTFVSLTFNARNQLLAAGGFSFGYDP